MFEMEHLIQSVIGAVLAGGLGYIWFDIRRIRKMSDEKIENSDHKVKTALYNKDGTTIFMPRAECANLHATFCKKIDDVKTIMFEARKEDQEDRNKLHVLMGKVESHFAKED